MTPILYLIIGAIVLIGGFCWIIYKAVEIAHLCEEANRERDQR